MQEDKLDKLKNHIEVLIQLRIFLILKFEIPE